MFKSRKTEQFNLITQEREMHHYLSTVLEGNSDIDLVRELFLEAFPNQEDYFDDFIIDYLF